MEANFRLLLLISLYHNTSKKILSIKSGFYDLDTNRLDRIGSDSQNFI